MTAGPQPGIATLGSSARVDSRGFLSSVVCQMGVTQNQRARVAHAGFSPWFHLPKGAFWVHAFEPNRSATRDTTGSESQHAHGVSTSMSLWAWPCTRRKTVASSPGGKTPCGSFAWVPLFSGSFVKHVHCLFPIVTKVLFNLVAHPQPILTAPSALQAVAFLALGGVPGGLSGKGGGSCFRPAVAPYP